MICITCGKYIDQPNDLLQCDDCKKALSDTFSIPNKIMPEDKQVTSKLFNYETGGAWWPKKPE